MSLIDLTALPSWADEPLGGLTQPFTDAQIQHQILSAPQDDLFISANGELIGAAGPGLPYLSVVWSPQDNVVWYTPQYVPQAPMACYTCVPPAKAVTPEPRGETWLIAVLIVALVLWARRKLIALTMSIC